jgi:lipopolysaccharide transport system permease protein
MDKHVKVYSPEAQLKVGFLAVWREMLDELISSRELIWRLFLRDFSGKYRQSILGVFWALIMPLILVGIFVFLNRSGILNIGDTGIPYPVYALLGLSIWQLFATGLIASTSSLVQGGTMIVKINFPKESLVIASLAQSVVEFIVRIALLVAVFALYKVAPSWTTIFLPVVLIPLLLLTIGLGLIFSLLNVIIRDMANIVILATTFLLFLTPVLYPAPSTGLFVSINQYNPLAILVSGARDVVIKGYIAEPLQFLGASLFSLVVFLVAWRIFHLVEPRMAERV